MSLLDHTPSTTEADAERIAADVFGISARAHALPSERDRAFLLDLADGTARVLKVSNGQETRDSLMAQAQAAKRALDAGLPVQQLYPALDGELVAHDSGHLVRLMEYIPGVLLAEATPAGEALLRDLGSTLGRLAGALAGFDHPAAHREFHWDVLRTPEVLRERSHSVSDPDRGALLNAVLGRYESTVVPVRAELRMALIHGDANDHNVVVGPSTGVPAERLRAVTGLLDFGDMVHSAVAAEPAVAAAYMMLDSDDPVAAVAVVVAGFDEQYPLTDTELDVVWELVLGRLALSCVNAAVQSAVRPDDPYLVVTEGPAWRTLEQAMAIPSGLARARIRTACGRQPHRDAARVRAFLSSVVPAPLLGSDWSTLTTFPVDLSIGSPVLGPADIGAPADRFDAMIRAVVDGDSDAIGLGGYAEARLVYTTPAFAGAGHRERRTVHLGVDVWTRAHAALHAPLDGVVYIARDNDAPQDYGPMVVLRHTTDDGVPFFSLYGHLARETLAHVSAGHEVRAGDVIGWVGDASVNGGWAPHAHVQVIVDLLGLEHDYPGVATPAQADVLLGLSPDPALLLGLPDGSVPEPPRPLADTWADRRRLLGPNLSVSYDQPLRIVRGIGSYLYDDLGRAYLDSVNNVAHVGHCHPRVVAAAARQTAVLNTNTRYLHESVLRYAERLTATLPEPLSVCFFVNSGSEANDLALRLIRAHTGKQGVVCLDNGYHGHTQALIDVSPYKHAGPGGSGPPPWVRVAAMPDAYRGPHSGYGRDTAGAYAADVQRCVDELGGQVSGLIAESMVGCGGQVVLPDGYLGDAAAIIRAAGGLVIADEVQVGFGRVGPEFWGFATQGLVPDVVTIGKPAGNGHPLAAVITTPEIAASFANGMEYFNTFGGNPVSAEIGLAVLDVIEDEQLPERAARTGARILAGGQELAARHALIGDVRGLGMYIGIELVRDRVSLEPAAEEADYVIQRLRGMGILVSTDGPFHNVLKVKPPLVWGDAEADRLLDGLDRALADPALRV